MIAYHLERPNFFKADVSLDQGSKMSVCLLSEKIQDCVKQVVGRRNVITISSSITLNGTKYCNDMFVSHGDSGGLPGFHKICNFVVEDSVYFILEKHESWYIDHIKAYSVTPTDEYQMVSLSGINDHLPLPAYTYNNEAVVVPKYYIEVLNG